MPRWLFTPRWLGLFVLLMVVVVMCWLLGRWQWEQARSEVVRSPPSGVVALTDAHSLGDPVATDEAGRLVRVAGTFDADRQALVVDREHEGQQGAWVVTALRVHAGGGGGTKSPAVIPVVRGWLPEGQPVPDPPAGRQVVTGVLEPSESDALRVRNREPLPPDQLEIVSSAELLSLWQPPLYQGFVIQQRPAPAAPLDVVSPPSRVSVVTDWQNAAYAIQWWLFGLFAIFWFGRMIRLESEDRAEAPAEGDEAALETIAESSEHTPQRIREDTE